jgi:nitrate/nitrite transport system substrate-binding protein
MLKTGRLRQTIKGITMASTGKTRDQAREGVDRRQLLKSASAAVGTAALAGLAKTAFPAGAFAQIGGPEVKGTRLGYIALTDASPLIIAKEKGFFAKHGLPDMEIVKQASWAATRDNMALGLKANGIDGGHILRPRRTSIRPARSCRTANPCRCTRS